MVAKGLINNGTQYFTKLDVWGAKRVRVEHDNVPPGFGLSSEAGKSWQPNAELDAGMAVTCSWRQPLKFLLDDSWLWARGEDSVEVASQQQRERRFFKAFYPRLASIPDRPMEPQEPSQEIDDTLVAGIPLVPFEDEEMVNENADQESIDTEKGVPYLPLEGRAKADVSVPNSDGLYKAFMEQKQESMISIADSNVAAAAAAACMVVQALGESDLVDKKLLLEILKNPSLLTSLTTADNVKGRNQDHDKGPPGVRQAAPQSCSVHTKSGACLNQSPTSVLAQWGDSPCDCAGMTISQRFMPTVGTRTHMHGSVSLNSFLSTELPKSFSCSISKSSKAIMQKGNDCPSSEHKQVLDVPKLNAFSKSTVNEVPSLQDFRPGVETGSKNDRISNSLHYCHMQAPPHISSTFRASPTLLPIKDLPLKCSMQEPQKYRSTEASSLKSKTTVYSTFKAGGRSKRLCMYFDTPRGCRNGDSCAFIHQSSRPGDVSSHLSLQSTASIS
ncbi:hypothetical protein L7F22_026105 [Adiantum nelumboides]|nr:hypothetical protein [Adiantum nelumboides]